MLPAGLKYLLKIKITCQVALNYMRIYKPHSENPLKNCDMLEELCKKPSFLFPDRIK